MFSKWKASYIFLSCIDTVDSWKIDLKISCFSLFSLIAWSHYLVSLPSLTAQSHWVVSLPGLTSRSHCPVSLSIYVSLPSPSLTAYVSLPSLTAWSHFFVSLPSLTDWSHFLVSLLGLTSLSHFLVSLPGLTAWSHRLASIPCLTALAPSALHSTRIEPPLIAVTLAVWPMSYVKCFYFYRPEGGGEEREADDWSQQSSEDLYNLNTLNGHASDPSFSPKPVKSPNELIFLAIFEVFFI